MDFLELTPPQGVEPCPTDLKFRCPPQGSGANLTLSVTGSAGGTRTHTVMLLRHAPPANWATAPEVYTCELWFDPQENLRLFMVGH